MKQKNSSNTSIKFNKNHHREEFFFYKSINGIPVGEIALITVILTPCRSHGLLQFRPRRFGFAADTNDVGPGFGERCRGGKTNAPAAAGNDGYFIIDPEIDHGGSVLLQ